MPLRIRENETLFCILFVLPFVGLAQLIKIMLGIAPMPLLPMMFQIIEIAVVSVFALLVSLLGEYCYIKLASKRVPNPFFLS